MKALIRSTAAFAVLGSMALTGCADGPNSLTTGSVNPSKVAAAPNVDPACVVLTAKIDALRKEGTMARLEKVAAGKSRSVMVKRAALGKAAALSRANTEFQAKCSTFKPSPTTAAKKKPAKPAKKLAKAASAAVKAKVAKSAVKIVKPVAVKAVAKKAADAKAAAKKAAASAAIKAAATAATTAAKP